MTARRIRQQPSHRALLHDISTAPSPPAGTGTPGGRMDAVIVPSSRTAGSLDAAVRLAADVGCLLVVLASRDSRIEDVAERAAGTPGVRALVFEVPEGYRHDALSFATSKDERFRAAGADRCSDLSTKRNLGLLLARLLGWSKVFFLDDDLDGIGPAMVSRLAHQLDWHRTAGLVSRQFPDNSVVCHANRLSGDALQDVFITGAALGVNCRTRPPAFFPDVYNEDWFFLLHDIAERRIPKVGEARQRAYDPYGDSRRAAREEFGDLLAEGLFALVESGDPLAAATHRYWGSFLDARAEFLTAVADRLQVLGGKVVYQALKSVEAAQRQLNLLSAELCVDYLRAWQDDLAAWQTRLRRVPAVARPRDAAEYLGLKNWRSVEFANPDVELRRDPLDHRRRRSSTDSQSRDSKRSVPASN